MKRGPEVYAYILTTSAASTIIISFFIFTIKEDGGYTAMFSMCFMAQIVAAACLWVFDEKNKVKYSDLYYDNLGIISFGSSVK